MTPMNERKLPNDYWTSAEVMKEIFEVRVCLAKAHSPDPCNGAIVKAHTIPKSQLQKIAAGGQVYAMRFTAADLARNDGALTAQKVGVGTFSVLNSFCAFHDNNVFKHVEDDPLVFDPHQLTLLHYRTICSELYRKVCSYHTLLHQIEEQQQKKLGKRMMDILKATAVGQQLGIQDVGSLFMRVATEKFKQEILVEREDRVEAHEILLDHERGIVSELHGPPPQEHIVHALEDRLDSVLHVMKPSRRLWIRRAFEFRLHDTDHSLEIMSL
jgi:hypothetical protein